MSKKQVIFITLLVALISVFSGYYLQKITGVKQSEKQELNVAKSPSPEEVIGSRVKDFSLMDLNGELRYLSEWESKLIAINFWATWCAPCREEIPAFIELQSKYETQGLQFIGIALEQAEDVKNFIEEFSINYPLLVGGDEVIKIATELGNNIGAMPYTVFINSEGIIAFTRRGPLTKEEAEAVIKNYL
jgi:thiol-disulfide isomerase/thioredoxin|tara:strand:+ start:2437 stop:3003 length:567 start_codon:yes stop_codon:yes gene_type:complete